MHPRPATQEGEGALPAEWKAQVPDWAQLEQLTDAVLARRQGEGA